MNLRHESLKSVQPKIMGFQDYLEQVEREQKKNREGELWSTQTHKLDRQLKTARSILETLDRDAYDFLVTQVEYTRLQRDNQKIDGKSLRRLEAKIRQLRDNKQREKQERDAEAEKLWLEQEKPFERFSVLAQSLSQENKMKIVTQFTIKQMQEFQQKLLAGDLSKTLRAYSQDHTNDVIKFLSSAITIKM